MSFPLANFLRMNFHRDITKTSLALCSTNCGNLIELGVRKVKKLLNPRMAFTTGKCSKCSILHTQKSLNASHLFTIFLTICTEQTLPSHILTKPLCFKTFLKPTFIRTTFEEMPSFTFPLFAGPTETIN